MKLCVITPTLGDSPWLAATIASVAAHAPGGDHILVVPPARVADLAAQNPGVTVIAEPGGGMYAAINAGLSAPGTWDAFTYLNDDDALLPGFAKVAAVMTGYLAEPALVYGSVRLIDRSGRRLGAIPVSPSPQLNRDLYAQRLEPVFQHGTLVNRAAWQRHGGFDPTFRFCGDSEFLARLCARGVPAVRVRGEVAAFRLRPGQLTKNRLAMTAERVRVDQLLGLIPPRLSFRHRWARLLFRTANLPVYAARIARHGFVSFDQLLERGG